MYLCARWFRTHARIPAASAIVDGTPCITKRYRQKIIFTFNICEYIYARSGSEYVCAFPTATAMADGTPGIPRNAGKNECIYPKYRWVYLRARWFRTRACIPAVSAIANGSLSILESERKKEVFKFNIRGCIYVGGGSERVRAFPAALAIADSTTKSARRICVFTFNICGRIYARGGSERMRAFWPLQRWLTAP